MTKEELDKVLESHKKWLDGDSAGKRAVLLGANLLGENLLGANRLFYLATLVWRVECSHRRPNCHSVALPPCQKCAL